MDIYNPSPIITDKSASLLHQIKWPRIICDESHVFSNYKSVTFAAMNALLNSENRNAIRYCLSGTPYRNKKTDLVSQLYFCGYRRHADNSLIEDIKTIKPNKSGILDVDTVYTFDRIGEKSKCLMPHVYSLQYGPSTIQLPELKDETIEFDLNDMEMNIYSQYSNYAKQMYTIYVDSKGENVKYATLFAAITRMRQCSIAPYLVYNKKSTILNPVLNTDVATSTTTSTTKSPSINAIEQIEENIEPQTMEGGRQSTFTPPNINPVTQDDYKTLDKMIENDYSKEREWLKNIDQSGKNSTRILKVIELLTNIYKETPNDKVLIFSSFTSALALLQLAIEEFLTPKSLYSQSNDSDSQSSDIEIINQQPRIVSKLYTGNLTQKQRIKLRQQFSDDPDFRIMSLSYKVGETGLNLQDANIVIFLDEYWNDAVTRQALARAFRIGQKKKVKVYRLMARSTIDERIKYLRLSKQFEWAQLSSTSNADTLRYESSYQLDSVAKREERKKLDLNELFRSTTNPPSTSFKK